MSTSVQDLRYAIRMFVKRPGFTAAVVATLALAIGANVLIFSVVQAVLLRPLPYPEPGKLVKIWGKFEKLGLMRNHLSEPEFWDLQGENQSFSELAVFDSGGGANLTSLDGEPLRISVLRSSATLFPLLGVKPLLGRLPLPDEDQRGKEKVAILSCDLWKSRFGADPLILGQDIFLNSERYEVIGVMPAEFHFAGHDDLFIPLGLDRTNAQSRSSHCLEMIARLEPEVTLAQASSELDRFAARLKHDYPKHYSEGTGWGMFPVALYDEMVGDTRPALLLLFGAAGFVLLIACANIANLLLARASGREREVAVRAALGAGKLRLVRQLVTEGLLLCLLGGALGLLIASWGVDVFRTWWPDALPRTHELKLDRMVLGFTLVLSLCTGVLFSLAPTLHLIGGNLHASLKQGARHHSAGPKGKRLRGTMVVAEMALALVLLVGAGLLIRSFQSLINVNPGFETNGVLTFAVSLPKNRYDSQAKMIGFYRELFQGIQALPGIQAAGGVSNLPLSDSGNSGSVFIKDTSVGGLSRLSGLDIAFLEADKRSVSPGYFPSMGVPLLQGRLVSETDDAQAPLVVMVDSDFAERLWPEQDPIGKQVALDAVPGSNPLQLRWRTIVGVVGHVKYQALHLPGRDQIYVPYAQRLTRTMSVSIRTDVEPTSLVSAVQQMVFRLDRDLPLYDVKTMEQMVSASVVQPKLDLTLLVLLAALALVLAAVGIHGVIACSVSQRVHEIGVRMALGARRGDILRLIVGQGTGLIVAGVALGLLVAFGLTRVMSSMLFDVSAADPLTYVAISVIVVLVALAATYIPARQATKVDPMVALRSE